MSGRKIKIYLQEDLHKQLNLWKTCFFFLFYILGVLQVSASIWLDFFELLVAGLLGLDFLDWFSASPFLD
ncbi:unnamed protein product [Rhizophagus irregularis]|uniref:Uncharacterized protein n=1 Tax=Rhizophagus irregularis TaxID=588596 RepID=A0A915YY27_9GLOM|nr:unnamed protein product [Rhizophagus irregularis]CAB5213087.1 unnamed protein product [Rhizophagus irregularis]CAB5351134.1 unnamed protein product [Rhizophagus irregularis]